MIVAAAMKPEAGSVLLVVTVFRPDGSESSVSMRLDEQRWETATMASLALTVLEPIISVMRHPHAQAGK